MIDLYGPDALRWWFLRDVPRAGDADFRPELIAARANELADGLGNLINRTIALVSRNGAVRASSHSEEPVAGATALATLCAELPSAIDAALASFNLRGAATSLWEVVAEANRFVSATQPWELAKAARTGDGAAAVRLDSVLAVLLDTCARIASELDPFLPLAAQRISAALADPVCASIDQPRRRNGNRDSRLRERSGLTPDGRVRTAVRCPLSVRSGLATLLVSRS